MSSLRRRANAVALRTAACCACGLGRQPCPRSTDNQAAECPPEGDGPQCLVRRCAALPSLRLKRHLGVDGQRSCAEVHFNLAPEVIAQTTKIVVPHDQLQPATLQGQLIVDAEAFIPAKYAQIVRHGMYDTLVPFPCIQCARCVMRTYSSCICACVRSSAPVP